MADDPTFRHVPGTNYQQIVDERRVRVERCRRIYQRAAALRILPDFSPEYMEPRAAPSVLAFIEALLTKLEDQA